MPNYQGQARSWFNLVTDQIHSVAERALKDAVEAGENTTKHFIENRGTEKSGKRGRVDTGQMRDAVTSGLLENNEDEIVGRFGFENAPSYASLQERGFVHTSGIAVEGMFALSDAGVEVTRDLEDDLKRGFRGV